MLITVREWRNKYSKEVKDSDTFECIHLYKKPIEEDDMMFIMHSYKKWTVVYHGLEEDERVKKKLGLLKIKSV